MFEPLGGLVGQYGQNLFTPLELSLVFASLTGAIGFGLSLLAYNRFKGSPFGTGLATLPPFMLLIAVYHPLLLLAPSMLDVAFFLETLAFVLLFLFAVQMVRVHRRLRTPTGGR